MSQYRIVGQSVKKLDAVDKVLGKAQFAADIHFDGMLYAKVFRSNVPHGILRSIDVSKAEALPGVAVILTGKDVPGSNSTGMIIKDEPVLVKNNEKIRKIGDPLALIAAETEALAEKALELIEVDIEVLPPVFDPVAAMTDSVPKIYADGNVLAVRKIRKGDTAAAFQRCAVVVEQEYRTQMVEHGYIEPEAGVAKFDGDVVTMWVSTQNTHFDAKEVARNLKVGLDKVRVIQAATGGGFGGKLDISVQVHLGLLAMKTRRPVKLVYTRTESIVNSAKRHPCTIKMKTGTDEIGKLLAMECSIIGDTGAYASYGPGTLTRTAVHATGPYEIPHVAIDAHTVYTNNPTAGAMRGFGVPQVAFAHESQMDMLAEKIGMSPLEIRLLNAFRPGSVTATGAELKQSIGIVPTLEKTATAAKTIFSSHSEVTCQKKRGVGIASMWYGIGNTGLPNPSGAYVNLLDDGTVLILTGCADIGQGSDTALAQIVAEEFGIDMEDIRVVSADTGITPDGGASSASRQTYISGNAVRLAAQEAKKVLIETAAVMLGVAPGDVVVGYKELCVRTDSDQSQFLSDCLSECRLDLGLSPKGKGLSVSLTDCIAQCRMKGKLTLGHGWFNPDTTSLDPETGQGKPYATYAFATQIAEVDVDTESGEIEVIRIIAAHDVGQAINPVNIEGQIEGGCTMGLGYALTEEIQVSEGKILTKNLATYLMPTALDVPEMYPLIVEEHEQTGPFGAKGVGEPTLIPTAAAIANAVYDAIGVRFTELPITPEKVLARLHERQNC
ncbi:xanthine dehydrogenase family protein molybdopterin-binding subunit [Sporomusa sp.]|uniref:xanthine dehydrogenase family protein molybdopterin-binding subunit n=1 Tax=Sporomusa sp. TaxID=2078658 RepID=UPI002C15B63A|nr:xanthine dehydrogenase family protein molybdopterin-binding subunit [Sporomusa sp.]HWR41939.1 xanthine dehydrogenase family protein molybdopterin-binding subunit [Sporomusa sp.]